MGKLVISVGAHGAAVNREIVEMVAANVARIEQGEAFDCDTRFRYETIATFDHHLPPSRQTLLAHITWLGRSSVATLAAITDRDEDGVRADLGALDEHGIVEMDGSDVRAMFSEVEYLPPLHGPSERSG